VFTSVSQVSLPHVSATLFVWFCHVLAVYVFLVLPPDAAHGHAPERCTAAACCRPGPAGLVLQAWSCRPGPAGLVLQAWSCRPGLSVRYFCPGPLHRRPVRFSLACMRSLIHSLLVFRVTVLCCLPLSSVHGTHVVICCALCRTSGSTPPLRSKINNI